MVTKTTNAIDVHFRNRSCEEFEIFVTKGRFITAKFLQNKLMALNGIITGIVNKKHALNGIITGIVNKTHLKSCLMQS